MAEQKTKPTAVLEELVRRSIDDIKTRVNKRARS